jgi:hypothetical protein
MPIRAADKCFNKVEFRRPDGGYCERRAMTDGDDEGFCGEDCKEKVQRLFGLEFLHYLQSKIDEFYSGEIDADIVRFRQDIMTIIHERYSTIRNAEKDRLDREVAEFLRNYMNDYNITAIPITASQIYNTGYRPEDVSDEFTAEMEGCKYC